MSKLNKSRVHLFNSVDKKTVESIALLIIKKYDLEDNEKSLDLFLDIYEDNIIMSIPDSEQHISAILEAQGFLNYKHDKWYNKYKYDEKLNVLNQKALTSHQLFDIGLRFNAFKLKHVLKYLLTPTTNWVYNLNFVNEIQQC